MISGISALPGGEEPGQVLAGADVLRERADDALVGAAGPGEGEARGRCCRWRAAAVAFGTGTGELSIALTSGAPWIAANQVGMSRPAGAMGRSPAMPRRARSAAPDSVVPPSELPAIDDAAAAVLVA